MRVTAPLAAIAARVAALLVPPRDAGALAAAIASLLDDRELAARLRAAGPRRAGTFTWDRAVEGHVGAYHRAAPVSLSA